MIVLPKPNLGSSKIFAHVIFTLHHAATNILGHEADENRYDTVGGINYDHLLYYLLTITILSEIWIYLHVYYKTKDIGKTFGFRTENRWILMIIRIFPIHFAIFEEAYVNIKNRIICRELEMIFREQLTDNDSEVVIHQQVLKCANKLARNYERMFRITNFLSQIQNIESCGERELQIVAQTVLFLNGRFFNRITTLFGTEFFGIDIKYMFAAQYILILLTITNNVLRYRNSKRYPFTPGLIGKILQPITVLVLVVIKIYFISISLSNAPYFHIVGHVLKIGIVYIFCKLFSNSSADVYEAAIAASNCAVFFRMDVKTQDPGKVSFLTKCLVNYGGAITTLILEGLSFIIYTALGKLIRYLQEKNVINPMVIPERDQTQDPLQFILRDFLVEFNGYYILLAVACTFAVFSVFSYVYYWKGHPKRNILNKKHTKDDFVFYPSGNIVQRTLSQRKRHNLSIQMDCNTLLDHPSINVVKVRSLGDNMRDVEMRINTENNSSGKKIGISQKNVVPSASTESKLSQKYIRIKRLTHISKPNFPFSYNRNRRSKSIESFEMKLFQGRFRNYEFDATDPTRGLLSSQIRYQNQNHDDVQGPINQEND